MTMPPVTPVRDASAATIRRAAVWVAIGALIAAAIVCVVMVLVGTASAIVPRAFFTILLMVAFAGVALLDTYLAPRRPVWFALTSMVVWVATLLIGAVMTWLPFNQSVFGYTGDGATRFVSFLLIVLILQLGVLHVRLYAKAWDRLRTVFTNIVGWVTVVMVALLAAMLVFPLIAQEWLRFHDLYWRLTVAVAILAAVGTALIPLVNALFAPRRPRVAPAWPTYADGVTPLPVLPGGQPDWNAVHAAPAAAQPTPAPTGATPVPDAAAWAAPEPPPAVAPERVAPAPGPAPAAAPAPAPGPAAAPAPEPWRAPADWPPPAPPAQPAPDAGR